MTVIGFGKVTGIRLKDKPFIEVGEFAILVLHTTFFRDSNAD
jgi:hypothetical protein